MKNYFKHIGPRTFLFSLIGPQTHKRAFMGRKPFLGQGVLGYTSNASPTFLSFFHLLSGRSVSPYVRKKREKRWWILWVSPHFYIPYIHALPSMHLGGLELSNIHQEPFYFPLLLITTEYHHHYLSIFHFKLIKFTLILYQTQRKSLILSSKYCVWVWVCSRVLH